MKKAAIIGAGAAGCFCAITLKRLVPDLQIDIYEAGNKPLAKVRVTGGGRCNLTNTFANVQRLGDVYPRGEQLMKRALRQFSEQNTWNWFENEGVRLVAQDDECVFPQSQNAMEIVNTLLRLIERLRIGLHLQHRVSQIEHTISGNYAIHCLEKNDIITADYVIVTTGGAQKQNSLSMFEGLDLQIEPPVPSLFTFNLAGNDHKTLMGNVVEDVAVSLAGTRFKAQGTLLHTHWGVSGPAILRLSSYAARHLADNDYRAKLIINWFGDANENEVREEINTIASQNGNKLVTGAWPTLFSSRHWQLLLQRANIPDTLRYNALNKKNTNRLINVLTADTYEITGRCPFKEEFVTCGGISLNNINISTLEAKQHEGLFFAGEILDVDAVTGGFNLQAAWSMGYVIAQSIARNQKNLIS